MDYDAPQVIKFIHASEGSEFVVDAVLKPHMGLTHDVFSESYEKLDRVNVTVTQNAEGEDVTTEEPRDITDWFKHIYVPEVVREPRINYQRVPRLGSYMAIPLIYQNCLYVEALEEAVSNWKDVQQRKAEQDREKQDFEDRMNADRDQALAQGLEFVPEDREWPVIELDPFQSYQEKYVVCIDTMGQDRELTVEQKRFALETVDKYIAIWEQNVRSSLEADRDRRLKALDQL